MRRPHIVVALVLAGPVAAAAQAAEPAAAPAAEPVLEPAAPDVEFLEFLGETVGLDPEIVGFMESREARRALKDAARKRSEEEDDE